MNSVFPCALTPAAIQEIARTYVSERYPTQLDIFHARFPDPPASPEAAHELGFVAGLLLGLDIAAHNHSRAAEPSGSTTPEAPASPATTSLLQLV